MKHMSKWLTAATKAQGTAQWARTMTTWLVTYRHNKGARWQVVDFLGKAGGESRGILKGRNLILPPTGCPQLVTDGTLLVPGENIQ